jgi:RNA polymerase sigma-70 factor (ECF subfamily)
MLTTSLSLLDAVRQQRDEVAWGRLVQLYTPLLMKWLTNRGVQQADAADLTQDIFRVLLRRLPGFEYDTSQSFRGWLRAITINHWKDHCRRQARQPVTLPALDVPEDDDCLSGDQHRRELVARALVVLQPEFRPESWAIFVEHGVKGRPASEVAKELGVTLGTVYVAKCRVLASVREYLRGILEESDGIM